MAPQLPRILYVEDDRTDRAAFERVIGKDGRYRYALAASLQQARRQLAEESFDIVVADYKLGDGAGLDLLDGTVALPIIIVTGAGDEAVAVQALKRGAYDYLVKGPEHNYLEILPLAVEGALARRRAEQALQESEVRQKQLLAELRKGHEDLLCILNHLRQGVMLVDDGGRTVFVNRSCRQILQLEDEDVGGRPWEQLCPLSQQDRQALDEAATGHGGARRTSVQLELPGGRRYRIDVEVEPDPRSNGGKVLYLYDVTDVHDLRRMLNDKASFEGMVGKSGAMQLVFEQIRELARLDSTVLIEGATGTGKELVARAIHDTGHRKDKPFVALNCAGLTESLLNSQLFGHARGAFTGAVSDQLGVFETADGGSLFLDEIGDVTPSVQTSLLRVLQEREIVRLGESTPRKVDVRILAATHRDLGKRVREGQFREDLLYRIRVARIKLPPLRHRRTDIPLLLERFLADFRAGSGKPVERCSDDVVGRLLQYHWPGNVRELQSTVEFSAIRCTGTVIELEHLPPEVLSPEPWVEPWPDDVEEERQRILAALKDAKWNRKEAARLLGISRATLYRRLTELRIMGELAPDARGGRRGGPRQPA